MRVPSMVLRMNELQVKVNLQQGLINFNFEELKEGISNIAKAYIGATFCDESIQNANGEIASLRKIKAAIDTRRKEVKKDCMRPYDEFESKVKEILEIIDKPINDIGLQIDDFEVRRVKEKKKKILTLYNQCIGENEFLLFKNIYNEKWENKTYKLSDIEKDMTDLLASVMQSVNTIQNMNSDSVPKALELFKADLSLANAITYVNSYEQQKQEIIKQEQEKQAIEEQRKKTAEVERIREEERKNILNEQQETIKIQHKMQEKIQKAKEEVYESLIPDVEEETQTYIYKLQIGKNGKEIFELYLESVGIEWELM